MQVRTHPAKWVARGPGVMKEEDKAKSTAATKEEVVLPVAMKEDALLSATCTAAPLIQPCAGHSYKCAPTAV